MANNWKRNIGLKPQWILLTFISMLQLHYCSGMDALDEC